jgi:hypothetical protein
LNYFAYFSLYPHLFPQKEREKAHEKAPEKKSENLETGPVHTPWPRLGAGAWLETRKRNQAIAIIPSNQ